MKQESVSSSRNIRSIKDTQNAHYKDDILDISDKEHKKLPCIDHVTNTKRVDPETDFVTSSHEEDVIHYAHEPELTYERDTTDDLFMLEQSSKGDTDLTGFVNENVSFLESIKHRPVMTPYRDWFPSLEKHEQVKCKEFRDTRGKVTRNTRKTDDDLSVVIPNAKVGLYTHSKTTSMKEFIMHSLHGSLVADSIPRLEVCSLCVAVFESLTSKDLFMYSRKTKVDQSNLSNLKITIQFPQYSDNKRCTVPNDHDSQIDSSRTNKKTRDQNLCKEGQMQSREASEASSLPIKLQNISTVGQCIKSNTIRKEEEENVGAITSEDNQTISKWTDNERKQTRNEKQTDNERKQTRNEKQTDNETKQTRYENLTDNETKQARNEKRTDNATKQTRDEKQTDNETKQTRNEKRTDNATKQAGNEKQTHCESKKGRDKSPDLVWNQSLIEKLRTEGSKSSEKLAQSSTNNRAADTSNNSTLKPNYERQKVSSGCELQSNNVTKLSTDRSQDLVWNRSLITKLRTEGSKSGEKLAQNSSNNRAVNKSMMSLVKPGGKTQDGREKVSSGCELGHGRSITPKQESLTNRLQKITNMPVPKEEKTKSEKSVKNEKRQARQFHPYKKEFKPKQFDTPTWSFDIAYSDMEELLQNLTENMFLLDSRVPADVRRWRKGTSRSSVGRVRGRFCGHRFTRSEVPKCLPSSVESRESDDDYVIDPDLISNMEERARQADMVEEKWQTKTEEETLFIEEMCIYNQDKDEVTSTDSSAHVKTVKSTTTLIVPGMGKTSTYSAEQLGDMDSSTEELFQDNNLHREQTPIVHNVSNKEKITTVSGLYSQPVTKSAGNDDSSFKGSSHARNNSNSSKSTTPAKYDNALSKNNAGAKNDHVSTRNTVCTKHDNARSEQDVFAINENATSKNSVCPKDDNGTSENRVCAKSDISLPYSAKNDIAPSKDSECDRYDITSCTNTISKSLYTGPEKGYADISKSDRTLDSLKGNKAKENHGQENIYVQSKLIWNNLTQDKGDGLTSIKAPTLTQRLSDQIKEEKEKVTKEWIEDINEDKPNVNCYATTKCVNETIFEENDSSKGQLQTPQTPGVFCMSGLQDKSILSSDSDVCLDWSDDEILLENGQEESSHDDDDDDKTFIVVDTLVEQDSDPTNIAVLHTRLTNQQLGLTETQLNVKESSLIDNNVKAGSMPITDSMCDVLNSCSEVIEKKKLKAAHQDKSASQDGTLFNVSQEMGIKGLNLQGDADTNYGKTFTAVSKIVSFKESLCEQDNVDKGSSVESVSNNEYAIHQDTDIDRTSVNKTKIDEKNTQKEYNENEQIIKDEHGYIDNLNKIMKLENENVDELYSCKTSTDFENFGQNTQQSAANYTSSSKDITKRENSDFQTNDRDSKSFLTTITAMKKDPDVLSCPDNESITTRTSAWQALPCDTDLNEIRKSQTINTSVSTPFVGEHLDRQAKPHKNLDYTTNHISHTELEEGNKCEKLNETEDRSLVNEIIKIKTNIKTEKESYFDSYSLYTDKAAIITSTNPCTIESSSSKISSFSCTGKPEANKTNAITHTNGSSASKTYSFSSSSKPIAKRTNISPTTQTSTSKTNSISSSSKPIASKPNTISSTTQTSTSKPTTIPCLIELSTNSDTVNKPRSTVGPVKTPKVHPITHQTFVPHQSFHSPPWLSATPQPLLSSQYDMFGSPYQQFNQPYNHLTHNNLLHYPNVTHVSPDMQSLYLNMTQFSPNAQCYYPNMSQISPNSLHNYSNRYDPHMLSYQQGHWNLNEPYHAQRSRSYQTMTSYSPQQSPQNGLNQSNTTNKQWEESLSSNAFRKK